MFIVENHVLKRGSDTCPTCGHQSETTLLGIGNGENYVPIDKVMKLLHKITDDIQYINFSSLAIDDESLSQIYPWLVTLKDSILGNQSLA